MARTSKRLDEDDENTVSARAGADDVPRTALVLPLAEDVMFPGAVLRVQVTRPRTLAVVEEALKTRHPIVVLSQRWASIPDPEGADLFDVGTLARLTTATPVKDGGLEIELQGLGRVKATGFLGGHPLQAHLDDVDEPELRDSAVQRLVRSVRSLGVAVLGAESRPVARELRAKVNGAKSAGQLADWVAAGMEAPVEEKQAILETLDPRTRLMRVRRMLERRRRELIGRARPSLHLFIDGLAAVVLTAYLASGMIPPRTPVGWPVDVIAVLAWIGLARELWAWLR